MRIPRFYQSGNYALGDVVSLNPQAFQHAIKVLRLTLEQKLILFDGQGHSFISEIVSLSKKHCDVAILEPQCVNHESPLQIHLCQSIIKMDKMDWILQKAVELGVTSITPIITEYTDVKLQPARLQKKMLHWHGVIISGCEQCGRSYLPCLNEPVTFPEMLKRDIQRPIIFCDPQAQQGLQQLKLPELDEKLEVKKLTLVIGPEGGFASQEIAAMCEQNYSAVKLGVRILRAETAAIVAITMCQSRWGGL